MKKINLLLCSFVLTTFMMSCKSSQPVGQNFVSDQQTKTSLTGEKVQVETLKLQGMDISEALSEDGTELIKRPYKWYAGIGVADNKQVAIEQAQSEAYATISKVMNQAVQTRSERGNIAVNGKVQQALTSHWEQFSQSLTKACEPYGETVVEYSQSTKMYTATAKVGVRGEYFINLLNTAGSFKPSDMSGEDLENFIQANKSIMDAARGN